MSKLITVFGATGTQGGSVIQAIQADPVLSKEFKIRAVTRDVSKPKSKELAASGCEVVAGDLSSAETILPAVEGSHTVFLVTNFWETMSAEVEVSQGKAVADASKKAGVKHLIASTLIDTTEASQGRLTHISHFDSKAQIEQYIRDTGVPATFYLPGFFMSNLLGFINKADDGASYSYAMPVSGATAQIPLVDAAADTGLFVAHAIKGFPGTQGRRIYGAVGYITPDELMRQFAEVIGKPAMFQQVPLDVFKGFLPPAAKDEMAENMLLLDDCGYYGGVDFKSQLAELERQPKSWKQFVEENKAAWL